MDTSFQNVSTELWESHKLYLFSLPISFPLFVLTLFILEAFTSLFLLIPSGIKLEVSGGKADGIDVGPNCSLLSREVVVQGGCGT